MDSRAWDERYGGEELVWSAEPNRFLVDEVEAMPPARALDLACGEGRDAVWLAERGWEVTGVDFSGVGLAKAERIAEARGARVRWVEADVTTWEPPPGAFELVVLFYLQLAPEPRRAALTRAVRAVSPGGTVLFVAHDAENLARGVGGPQDPAVLYRAGAVAGLFAAEGLEVERALQVERAVLTEDGTKAAIDTLVRARRPAGPPPRRWLPPPDDPLSAAHTLSPGVHWEGPPERRRRGDVHDEGRSREGGRVRADVPAEIPAGELVSLLGGDHQPVLVDVREPEEFADWSIPGAINVPLGQLDARHHELDIGLPVVVICASGSRSQRAASALRAAGLPVANLAGGMQAWATVYDTAEIVVGLATIVQLRRRGKGCLSYVVGSGDVAFVVDPSADVERYLQVAGERGWRITRAIDTHLHADHLSGARAIADATGASLHLGAADGSLGAFHPLVDGEWLPLGEATDLGVTVLATPGHTEGSVVLHVAGRAVLTGDALFVDGVGRPDLADRAEEHAHLLHRSLHTKVLALPVETLVLPAHYGHALAVRPGEPVAANLGDLRSDLPQLQMGEAAFVTWATSRVTERPPHFADIVRVNRGEIHLPLQECRRLELGPNRCAA